MITMKILSIKITKGLGKGLTWGQLLNKISDNPEKYFFNKVYRWSNPENIMDISKSFSHYQVNYKNNGKIYKKKLYLQLNSFVEDIIEKNNIEVKDITR